MTTSLHSIHSDFISSLLIIKNLDQINHRLICIKKKNHDLNLCSRKSSHSAKSKSRISAINDSSIHLSTPLFIHLILYQF